MGSSQHRLDREEQGFERQPSKMAGKYVVEQRESTVESRVRSDIPSKNTDQILGRAQKEAPARVRKSLLGTVRQKSFRSLRVILNKG